MQRNSDSDNRNRRDDGRLPFMPPKGWSTHYVIVFSALMLLYGISLLVTLPEDYIVSEDASGLRNLVNDLSSAMPFVAFLSYLATEAMRAMVFFSEKVKESRDRAREVIKAEGRVEGEARGITRGKAERDAAWREWFDEFEKARLREYGASPHRCLCPQAYPGLACLCHNMMDLQSQASLMLWQWNATSTWLSPGGS